MIERFFTDYMVFFTTLLRHKHYSNNSNLLFEYCSVERCRLPRTHSRHGNRGRKPKNGVILSYLRYSKLGPVNESRKIETNKFVFDVRYYLYKNDVGRSSLNNPFVVIVQTSKQNFMTLNELYKDI